MLTLSFPTQSLMLNAETVTFTTADGYHTAILEDACRYDLSLNEAQKSHGVYLSGRCTWTFGMESVESFSTTDVTLASDIDVSDPTTTADLKIKPGATITDALGAVHTVLNAVKAPAMGFWKVETINLALAYNLTQTVTVETPTISSDSATGRSSSFATLRSSVSCRIQPESTTEFDARGMTATETKYSVYLDPSTGTGSTFAATNATGDWCRLLWGSVYLMIEEYTNAERLDELPLLRCRKVP